MPLPLAEVGECLLGMLEAEVEAGDVVELEGAGGMETMTPDWSISEAIEMFSRALTSAGIRLSRLERFSLSRERRADAGSRDVARCLERDVYRFVVELGRSSITQSQCM